MAAINKVIDHFGLRSKVNLTVDPCTPGVSWGAEDANPKIACDCAANICHITHLSVPRARLSTKRAFHFATCNKIMKD